MYEDDYDSLVHGEPDGSSWLLVILTWSIIIGCIFYFNKDKMMNTQERSYVEAGFEIPNFKGEIIAKLKNGGFLGTVIHREKTRHVVYNSEGKCFDIYADQKDKSSNLIVWERYDLQRIKNEK